MSGVKKRILVVEDEELMLRALKKLLESEKFEVITATNGKQAKELVSLDGFDAVVSDIHMPGSPIDGLDLLKYIKGTSNTPVILMTGFSTLTETEEAHELGVLGFLAKPFQKDELLAVLRSTPGLVVDAPAPLEADMDGDYSRVSIDDFVSGKRIKYNIFIRLSQVKYVKVAHEGEDLDIGRVRSYKEKGIRHLFLSNADFQHYMRANLGLSQLVAASSKIAAPKKMNFLKHTQEVLLESFFTREMDADSVEYAKSTVETSVSFLCDGGDTCDLLSALNSHSDFLYAHSIGVSLYATLIARNLDMKAPSTLHKLAMAGLLHDIGLKQIDRKILEKPRVSLTAEEERIYEGHPQKGAEILSSLRSVPGEVLQIVLQHQERDSGSGYPFSLTKNKIFPLARIVAVADEFCELVLAGPASPSLSPREALNRMRMLYSNSLDQDSIRALGKLFNLDGLEIRAT